MKQLAFYKTSAWLFDG